MPKKGAESLQDRLSQHAKMFDPKRARLAVLPGDSALSLVLRRVPGGRNQVLQLLLMAAQNGDEDAQKLVYVFQNLSKTDQANVRYEDLCSACGVKPSRMAAIVVSTAVDFNLDACRVAEAFMRTDAVEAMGKSAVRISGKHAEVAERDRVRVLQAAGMVPIPRNSHLHLHAPPNHPDLPGGKAEESPIRRLPAAVAFKDDMDAVAQASDRVRARLMEAVPVEAHVVEDEN